MIGMFCALDLLLFYIFFEAVLIPMFIIIGIWGGARRVYAAFKMFLYTLLGSVLMLVAMLTMYYHAGTTECGECCGYSFPIEISEMAVAGILCLVRDQGADVAGSYVAARRPREAPTAGSVILAGVLLKIRWLRSSCGSRYR